jgi:phospholipid/cholesterol/gamma-HCH transport system substrate-binding protein
MSTDTTPQKTYTDGPVQTKKVKLPGRSFSSRNPFPIGLIGLVLIGALLWGAFNASKLPIIGSGTTYTAYFAEDANLQPNDEVQIAGVKVGSVSSTTLQGNLVKVTFKVKGAYIGDQSTAAIKLKTLLGTKLVSIDSIGSTALDPHTPIPVARTTTPFDVYPAFNELTQTAEEINTSQLSQAFRILAADFKDTPSSVKPLLSGLNRLSATISSRDAELQTLFSRAKDVTGVLASRNTEIQQLLSDGNLLLAELNSRRDAIHSLLVNTSTLAQQLEGLVADNQKTLGPMLASVHGVLALLQNNQDSLDRGLQLMAPFYRVFNNTIGNGRWFDNYIQNLNPGGFAGLLNLGAN